MTCEGFTAGHAAVAHAAKTLPNLHVLIVRTCGDQLMLQNLWVCQWGKARRNS